MRLWSVVSSAPVLLALLVVACGAGLSAPPQEPLSAAVQGVTPARNLHLRAAFDDNPKIYVGRFVPADVKGAELDENRAAQTVCSKHFKVNEVSANQELDELMYASDQASASVGVVGGGGFASGRADQARGRVLRVHYKITKKIQVEAEPEGLAACCARTPGACTNLVMGEFLRGSGEIYTATESERRASGEIGVPPVAAKAAYSDASQWKKLQSFQDTFFAFLPVATGVVNAAAQKAADDKADQSEKSCEFCSRLPESDSGMYFCGISPPTVEEATGRDTAMQNARTQVVRYLGEQIETNSKSLSTTAKGLLADERYSTAVAKGVASFVKDQKHCAEKENSPEHRTVYKVLTFVQNEALIAASQNALKEIAVAKGTSLTEKDKDALRDAVAKPKAK